MDQVIECKKCSQGVSQYKNRMPPCSVIANRYTLKKGYERTHTYTHHPPSYYVLIPHTEANQSKRLLDRFVRAAAEVRANIDNAAAAIRIRNFSMKQERGRKRENDREASE